MQVVDIADVMVFNVALIVFLVLLAVDCLLVSVLVVARVAPRLREWFAVRPSRR